MIVSPSPMSKHSNTMLLLLSLSLPPPLMVNTQSQKTNDAMVLKTLTGTQWRIIKEQRYDNNKMYYSTATFDNFTTQDNKGTISITFLPCNNDTTSSATTTTLSGR